MVLDRKGRRKLVSMLQHQYIDVFGILSELF